MKNLKILYIGSPFLQNELSLSGGHVIKNRNFSVLQSISKDITTISVPAYTNPKSIKFFLLAGKINGYTPKMDKELLSLCKKNNYDLIFIDTSSIGKINKKILKSSNSFIFFHNVEYNFCKSSSSKNESLKRRLFTKLFLKQTFNSEKNYCNYAKRLITLNDRDSKELKRLYGREADFLWPTSFKDKFNPKHNYNKDKHFLLFVGSDFFGNTDGLFWFIENCMPQINYELVIIGQGMDKYSNKYNNSNIHFLGFVEDLSSYYYDADAVVLPIISGSGMKTKTCEAYMYGKHIFGTTEAFEGYNKYESTDSYLCNTAEEFISKINIFLSNCSSEIKISNTNRRYFLDNYEETTVCNTMKNNLLSVL